VAEHFFTGIKNRIFQKLARELPGAMSLRPILHRWRGVNIGKNVWVGYDAIIETAHPDMVTIKEGATVGIRSTIIAHFWDFQKPVVLEEDVFLGPGAIVLPNVTIGRGAVVAAGSVVTNSVPPHTLVQGNPAKPIARVGKPPKADLGYPEFIASLRPLKPPSAMRFEPDKRTGTDR